jgi:hypothetical protein
LPGQAPTSSVTLSSRGRHDLHPVVIGLKQPVD